MKLYKVYIDNTTYVSRDVTVDVDGINSVETVAVEVDDPIVVGYYAVENEEILKQDIFKGYTDFSYEELPMAYGDVSQVANAINTVNGKEMIVEMKNNLEPRIFNNVVNFVLGKPLIDKPVPVETTSNRGEGTNGQQVITYRGEGTNGYFDIRGEGTNGVIVLRGEGTNGFAEPAQRGEGTNAQPVIALRGEGTNAVATFRGEGGNATIEPTQRGEGTNAVITFRGEGTNGYAVVRGEGGNAVFDLRGEGSNGVIQINPIEPNGIVTLRGEGGNAVFTVNTGTGMVLRGEGTNGLMATEEDVTNALKEYFEEQVQNLTVTQPQEPVVITEAVDTVEQPIVTTTDQVTVEQIQEVQAQIDKKIQDQIQFIEVRDALLPLLEEELQRILNEQLAEQQQVTQTGVAISSDVQEPVTTLSEQPITKEPIQSKETVEEPIVGIAETVDDAGNVIEKDPLQVKEDIADINKLPVPEPTYTYQEITEEDIQSAFVYTTTQLQTEKEVQEMFITKPTTSTTIQAEESPTIIEPILQDALRGEGTNALIENPDVLEEKPVLTTKDTSIVNNFGDSIMVVTR